MNRENVERFLYEYGYPLDFQISMIAGDASDRSFWRVDFMKPIGAAASTMALMCYDSDQSSAGLEDFISVQQEMKDAGIPVPTVYAYDTALGMALMEDFGDTMLEHVVQGEDMKRIEFLYRKAVDAIVDIQVYGTEEMDDSCVAFSRSFDVEKLMFEFNFFHQHAVLGHKAAIIDPADEKTIKDGYLYISSVLSSQPRFMTHRDYHCRNIMVLADDSLGLVDFQDARLGPVQYDLVSLLLDSYAKLPADLSDRLYEYYLEARKKAGAEIEDREEFDRIYAFQAAQRSIKAAGSFAYLDTVKMKNRYLAYFGTALGYAGAALARIPELEPFRAALSKYAPEIIG